MSVLCKYDKVNIIILFQCSIVLCVLALGSAHGSFLEDHGGNDLSGHEGGGDTGYGAISGDGGGTFFL